MNHFASHSAGRRAFLQRTGQLALTGAAMPIALNLAAVGDAAALVANDYRALVCVFMVGGNDHDNTVVPFDADSHAQYSTIRAGNAIARSGLAATVLNPAKALPGGRQYALHPQAPHLARLFNDGKAAVVLNVGPLVAPITRVQYDSRDRKAYPLPPKLFSHNDQASIWLSQSPEGSAIGWGGRLGDLALEANGQSVFTCVSSAGAAVFLAGEKAFRYQVGPNGPNELLAYFRPVYGSAAVSEAMVRLAQQSRSGLFESEYAKVVKRSASAYGQISGAMYATPLKTAFPGSPIGSQLKTVAQVMSGRAALGVKRQVFMVQHFGFDTHGSLATQHPRLLGQVSEALGAFYDATVELGIASQVTTFTASDFGRTLSVNGDGSDHGWGSHHFIVGGAVKGKSFWGTPPPISVGNTTSADDQWHVGQGRLLPTTSVDQMAATLARWFGAADSELHSILPNLHHFDTSLGAIGYPKVLGFL